MPQATPFDTILAQCRDLVCERLAEALAGMLDNADDTLSTLIQQTRDAKTQKLYQVTRNKALAQRESIVTQFRMRYLHEFQQRGNRVKKIGAKFDEVDLSSLELELVAEDDLNETLKFDAMAGRLRRYCDEELVALDQRIGVLLGDANLQAEDNPFTPQAICDAYKQTCRQIDTNVDVRMVLLKLFDDHVLDDIRAVYKAANALLVENSILPKIRFAVTRSKDGKTPPADEKSPEDADRAADKAAGGEQDLFSMLQKLLASNAPARTQSGAGAGGAGIAPGSGGGAGGGVLLEGADLLRSLTRLQLGDASNVSGGGIGPLAAVVADPGTKNILHELKSTSVGSGMNHMDVMTLDIMTMLFDQLFDDPKIPVVVKGLIGRLQIPMLKVAIADKAFFSRKTHPARLMLDTLGEISSRLPADVSVSDPIYGQLESILHELMVGFEDDIKIFDVMRERLQALVVEQDQRAEQETLSAAKHVEQVESLALAKTVAQAEIKVRVRASKAPREVAEFLVQQWVKLLLVVQVKDGEDSEAWKDALETADILLWSVEPKVDLEERRQLVASVPDLLKRLTEGLKSAGVDDDIRLRFFAELRRLHSELIGRVPKPETVADNDEQAIGSAPAEPAGVDEAAPVGESAVVDESKASAAADEPETPAFADEAAAPEIAEVPGALDFVAQTEVAATDDKPGLLDMVELPESSEATAGQEEAAGDDAAEMPAPPDMPEMLPSLELPGETAKLAKTDEPEIAPKSGGLELVARPDEPPKVSKLDELTFASEPKAPAIDAEPEKSATAAAPKAPDIVPKAEEPQEKAPAAASPASDMPFIDFGLLDLPKITKPEPASGEAAPKAAVPPAVPPKSPAPAPRPAAPAASTPAPKPTVPPAPATPASRPAVPPASTPAPKPATPAASAPAPRPGVAPPPASRPPAAAPTPGQRQPAPAAAPAGTRPAAAAPARTTAQPATADRSPAPARAQATDTGSLDFSAAVTIKNPFGEGEVQVDDLDFTGGSSGKSAGGKRDADYAALPDNLAVGSWVEIRDTSGKDAHRRAKLSFITPLKTRYLFVNKQGQTVLECSRAELARRFKIGDVKISAEVAEVPLFDRIAEGLVGKLAGPKAPR